MRALLDEDDDDPEGNLAASAVSGQAPPAGPQWLKGLAPLEVLPTWNLTAWYATSSRIGLALFLIVTSYGFVTALAGRPLLGKGLLED